MSAISFITLASAAQITYKVDGDCSSVPDQLSVYSNSLTCKEFDTCNNEEYNTKMIMKCGKFTQREDLFHYMPPSHDYLFIELYSDCDDDWLMADAYPIQDKCITDYDRSYKVWYDANDKLTFWYYRGTKDCTGPPELLFDDSTVWRINSDDCVMDNSRRFYVIKAPTSAPTPAPTPKTLAPTTNTETEGCDINCASCIVSQSLQCGMGGCQEVNKESCSGCNSGYYLNTGKCAIIPEGKFFEWSIGLNDCADFAEEGCNNATCSSRSDVKCTECKDGFALDNVSRTPGKCVNSTPSPTTPAPTTNGCASVGMSIPLFCFGITVAFML
jgi:hypothetical protein